MLDQITGFLRGIVSIIGRGIRLLIAWLVWPFMAAHGWYRGRHLWVKAPIAAFLVLLVGLYGYFIWQTQVWSGFNPNFVDSYRWSERNIPAGQELPAAGPEVQADAAATSTVPKQCQTSAIADAAVDLTDMNVNQNAWISSMLLYRLGFFGMDWDDTPFLDNKASFQRGVNQAVRRTSVELVDTLARVRGTSGVNNNLQDARSNLQFDEYSWYFGLSPFGPKTPTPSYYRAAIDSLRKFNVELGNCSTMFDSRADNLVQFLDRVANDLGGTSAILRERSENYNGGWFDTRADDRFWFAYGQIYGYYALLSGAGADFSQVIRERNLSTLWGDTLKQMQAALRIQPAIISNGAEDGWIMPTHLAVMGFYTLRIRSNLVEIRSVLDR
ncbi:hypothetical protein SAMN03159496_03891 [Rhizobium sp. NFR07]|uniref:DUF2333 family protein n=1 Tax=Rhizobium sp. NFR07 TaxID=1566262 RepID=UPI0008E1FCA0|nr:DUF2333 family protein [Rhizobium sp. NFR07]SFB45763.1 hypothetical protein SAMN03159496_03891 [Rhizobium sp. NFR07]